jgi:hypothetical protein
VAVTVHDGVAVWDLGPDHLADTACRLAGRSLAASERAAYLGEIGERLPTCAAYAP